MNSILFVLVAALIASSYYYFKEKKLLREFIRSSRRHRFHQQIDGVRRQKASRYLTFSIVLFFISLPLLIEDFVEGFIEDNWKWLTPVICISIFLRLFMNYTNNRNSRMSKSLAMSYENNNNP